MVGHISTFQPAYGPRIHRDESKQETTSQSQTNPWAAAMPEVQGLLNGVGSLIPNVNVNGTEQSAIDQLTAQGMAGNPFMAGTSGAVNNLLAGGGATAQNGNLSSNLASYTSELQPYTDPNYSTINTPAVQAALKQVQDDVTNQVNGQFAAAGRSGSAMNTEALARGIAQGEAPIILNQANHDTATRLGVAGSVYGAGNTTAAAITGNNNAAATNQAAGVNSVAPALTNSTWGPRTALTAQELGQSLPASNLGLLANIGIPLAQLGQTSSGTSTTTSNPSLLQDVVSVGSLLGSGKSTGANGASSAGSGILGLLGML
ncbi:tail fiber domain-containing protein [Bradyrhizobium ivorense]|uniref:tail fiber domain-containing protein n=1 Tax=Bradyrhizobium ivorense TaxID=2511166 RepID=UPI0010BBAD8E|nr:tail fiber domain-containing protein [Bradyrhizobium ivorense]VIO73901.1 hypothetical protein CI41S_40100 [Bradyrhizobium ivorense]